MAIARFLRELKRRRVYRVMTAYAVVAWLTTQVTATVAPALFLPGWTLTFVVVMALIGFPVAAVLAWVYDVTPDGVQRTGAPSDTPDAGGRGRSAAAQWWLRGSVAGAVLILLALAGWAGLHRPAGDLQQTSPDIVAVMPFRVSADPSLAYLREGMLDLLAAKLTGDVGAAAVDARSVLLAWARHGGTAETDLPLDGAIAVGRAVGAGQVLLGEVVSMPPRLTITARLVNVADGSVAYRAAVEGPADSLPALVDGLAARLLLVQAGEADHRLESLTSTSLPALTAYLQAQALFRDGRIEDALDRYVEALDADSTFVLAALGAWAAQVWGFARQDVADRVRDIAWSGRHRLSERDRMYLFALAGPDYPDESTAATRLQATRAAVNAAPDRPELWYQFGDVLTHDGGRLGIGDWRRQAIDAFQRVGELGPMSSEAIVHLLDLLIEEGDTATARHHGEKYLAQAPEGEVLQYIRWLLHATTSGATEQEAGTRTSLLGWRTSRWVVQNAQLLGPGFVMDAEHAMETLRRAPQPPAERPVSIRAEAGALLNAGRPEEASRALARLAGMGDPRLAAAADRWRLYLAMYWGGLEAEAIAAADRVAAAASDEGAAGILNACVLEQWRMGRGELQHAAATVRRLRSPPADLHPDEVRHARVCAAMLEALHADARGLASRDSLADRFEAELLEHLPYDSYDMLFAIAPLVAARLRAERGDAADALAWARRRPGAGSTKHLMLSTYLREEGRIAAAAGDRAAAARAWSHYLALRRNPEASALPDVDYVRAELARLQGEDAVSPARQR